MKTATKASRQVASNDKRFIIRCRLMADGLQLKALSERAEASLFYLNDIAIHMFREKITPTQSKRLTAYVQSLLLDRYIPGNSSLPNRVDPNLIKANAQYVWTLYRTHDIQSMPIELVFQRNVFPVSPSDIRIVPGETAHILVPTYDASETIRVTINKKQKHFRYLAALLDMGELNGGYIQVEQERVTLVFSVPFKVMEREFQLKEEKFPIGIEKKYRQKTRERIAKMQSQIELLKSNLNRSAYKKIINLEHQIQNEIKNENKYVLSVYYIDGKEITPDWLKHILNTLLQRYSENPSLFLEYELDALRNCLIAIHLENSMLEPEQLKLVKGVYMRLRESLK